MKEGHTMNYDDYPPTTLTATAVELQQGAKFYEQHKDEPLADTTALGFLIVGLTLLFVLLSLLGGRSARKNNRRVTP